MLVKLVKNPLVNVLPVGKVRTVLSRSAITVFAKTEGPAVAIMYAVVRPAGQAMIAAKIPARNPVTMEGTVLGLMFVLAPVVILEPSAPTTSVLNWVVITDSAWG